MLQSVISLLLVTEQLKRSHDKYSHDATKRYTQEEAEEEEGHFHQEVRQEGDGEEGTDPMS